MASAGAKRALIEVMTWHASLTFDYTGLNDSNERYYLMNALEAVGWFYVETSAMMIETDDFAPIAEALDLLGRAVDRPGILSNLAFNVVLEGHPRPTPGGMTPRSALRRLQGYPSPLP